LSLSVAAELVAERAVLVGSAAHGLHPVAAQGFNLGLRDVAALAELLSDATASGAAADVGDPELLTAYSAWRRDDHRKVVQFTDGLIRGFGVAAPVAGQLRGLALTGFDMLPAAKRALARQTMGLGGRMSRLARGLSL
jgi:2-octaprenyl-6-methoxyphenol hydroxylase